EALRLQPRDLARKAECPGRGQLVGEALRGDAVAARLPPDQRMRPLDRHGEPELLRWRHHVARVPLGHGERRLHAEHHRLPVHLDRLRPCERFKVRLDTGIQHRRPAARQPAAWGCRVYGWAPSLRRPGASRSSPVGASRYRAPWARRNSRWLRAGYPDTVAPGGMSPITPPCTVTRAPRPMVTWSASPACPARNTSSSTCVLPAMPACPAIKQRAPIRQLCPICTRLSIFVPAPMTVSSTLPR